MRPASDLERRRLNELFARLCAIPSPSRHERAIADAVAAELRALNIEVTEDAAAASTGGNAGNLIARIPGRSDSWLMLCAHLDTVPHGSVPIEPQLDDGQWVNANEAILGADNKASIAVLLALAHRVAIEGTPIGLELVFTVCEEDGLLGARALDLASLQARLGYVFDHATPIGEIIVASPTHYRIEASFRGAAAHAGIRPQDGRSAILAAAKAISTMRLGRIDDETTANIGVISGGTAINVVPEHCRIGGEVRSLSSATAEQVVTELVDRCQDAANLPDCECDVDVVVEQMFEGYRHKGSAAGVVSAEDALRSCGYEPRRIVTGGASDANVFEARGLPCTNIANGTERNHEPGERVSVAALEGMLDVAFALVDSAARGAAQISVV